MGVGTKLPQLLNLSLLWMTLVSWRTTWLFVALHRVERIVIAIMTLLGGGRTRPALAAHSRLDAKTRQHPRLQNEPGHKDSDRKQDFHFVSRICRIVDGLHSRTSGKGCA